MTSSLLPKLAYSRTENPESKEETDCLKTLSHQEKLDHYFPNTKFHKTHKKWRSGLLTCMGMSLAGYKKVVIRLLHANQVKILLDYINPKGDNITCPADNNGG